MFRARRTIPEPRLEIMPLIDVIFLLLTFFIFALVLMVRADLVDVRVPRLESGRTAAQERTISITLTADGSLRVDGETVASEQLIERLTALRTERPEATLLIAADVGGRSGDLLALVDRLVGAGLGEFSLVGAPGSEPRTAPNP